MFLKGCTCCRGSWSVEGQEGVGDLAGAPAGVQGVLGAWTRVQAVQADRSTWNSDTSTAPSHLHNIVQTPPSHI